ncbi:glycosyltransferase [Duganella sp. FT80W]|uniref:Glycosyltransferase n=1 Tax=Duganella guangzhouensis TaxID=2666084 RepID=A0A6I2L9L0_9BURK|nr:glycosyltransferase [Duganella guangzhouensis]MRW94941.1 glycosyltransferase [Duganella guangzhouensis]
MARIDILLPVHNGLPYLGAAIASIRRQSVRDWRLLILDHGSSDGSVELAERHALADARIELLDFSYANGLAELLNLGLERCDGRYVMRHDADDICLPDRIAQTMAGFAQHPGKAVISGQAELIDADDVVIGALRLPLGSDRLSAASLFRNPISHPALTMDRALIGRLGAQYGCDFLGLLPAEQRPRIDGLAEDYLMFGQLALLGLCVNLGRPLIQYRWHAANVSSRRLREQIRLSLTISRFLARTFCRMHALPEFDPAPFCNHGGQLLATEDSDFDAAFAVMAQSLRRGLGASAQLERELRYRHTLAHRRLPHMLLRYARFRQQYPAETGEWLTLRSWLLRHLPGRALMEAA